MEPIPGAKARPLFAVIIGINDYEVGPLGGLTSLRGAVRDATSVKEYLEKHLVPTRQIVLLTNKDATRSAIIKNIADLGTNPDISEGDPILIFYAGHGAQIPAPKNWECGNADRLIEAIVPHDCDSSTPSGELIAPIPDLTFNALLLGISKEKGNNITVIFDCCHSGSVTRRPENITDPTGPTPRIAYLLPRTSGYPDDLDKDILVARSTSRSLLKAGKFVNHGLGSHTLLAACLPGEQAHEGYTYEKTPEGKSIRVIRGYFSAALLKLLHTKSAEELRYHEIIDGMTPLPEDVQLLGYRQTPQCEGHYKDRTLFNLMPPPSTLTNGFPIRYERETKENLGHHIIEAGLMQNVANNSEFTVYHGNDIERQNPIGVLGVKTLEKFSLIAKVPDVDVCPFDSARSPAAPIAIQTRFGEQGNLRVWIEPSNGFRAVFEGLKRNHSERLRNVTLVSHERESDIELKLTEKQELSMKIFTMPHLMPAQSAFDWTIDDINQDPDSLINVLFQVAIFYGELRRPQHDPRISNSINVEFYKLDHDIGAILPKDSMVQPLTPLNGGENLWKDGVVTIRDPDGTQPYGIKLTNDSNVDFFVDILSFTNNNLSISRPKHYVHSSAAGKQYFPLRQKQKVTGGEEIVPGTLTIGYGSGGYSPLSFEISDNKPQTTDVDFIKIYFTTEHVDLSYLEQPPPVTVKGSTTRAWKAWKALPFISWSHIIIPVIQHSPGPETD